jgi:hypothetical protein
MKEKILEIMSMPNDLVYGIMTDEQKASDITAMVMEFAEWCIKEVGINWENEIVVLDADKDFNTVEELFNYWLTNIYKK